MVSSRTQEGFKEIDEIWREIWLKSLESYREETESETEARWVGSGGFDVELQEFPVSRLYLGKMASFGTLKDVLKAIEDGEQGEAFNGRVQKIRDDSRFMERLEIIWKEDLRGGGRIRGDEVIASERNNGGHAGDSRGNYRIEEQRNRNEIIEEQRDQSAIIEEQRNDDDQETRYGDNPTNPEKGEQAELFKTIEEPSTTDPIEANDDYDAAEVHLFGRKLIIVYIGLLMYVRLDGLAQIVADHLDCIPQ
jgi:hypothetical protein